MFDYLKAHDEVESRERGGKGVQVGAHESGCALSVAFEGRDSVDTQHIRRILVCSSPVRESVGEFRRPVTGSRSEFEHLRRIDRFHITEGSLIGGAMAQKIDSEKGIFGMQSFARESQRVFSHRRSSRRFPRASLPALRG